MLVTLENIIVVVVAYIYINYVTVSGVIFVSGVQYLRSNKCSNFRGKAAPVLCDFHVLASCEGLDAPLRALWSCFS